MQINWTLVAGLAAFSLAAAANWDAGTAAGDRHRPWRGSWRGLAIVHLLLLGEVIAGWRFGAVDAIDGALPGVGRHAVQIGIALAMLLIALGGTIAVVRAVRGMPAFALAALVALAAAMLFGVEALSVRPVGVLLYRPVGPVMLIAWAWLAIGLAAVGSAIAAVRSSRR